MNPRKLFAAFGSRSLQSLLLGLLLGALLAAGMLFPRAQADELSSDGNFVTAAVDRVGPAVVRIDTERIVSRQVDPFFDDPFFRRFFGETPPGFSTLRSDREVGQGSGFIIDSEGIVLTNAHVVNEADEVDVTLKDGRTFEAEVLGTDSLTDLAVLRVSADGPLPTAPLGDSAALRVGDWAIAVGNPLGLDNTVTLGIVSTLNRLSAQVGIHDKRIDFIQTDAAINPGNSGGPLLDRQGAVIGINTAIRADATGIGFAIPINQAKAIYPRLLKGQSVEHPYVGVEMTTLTADEARRNNEDPNSGVLLPEINGILVLRVLPGTPSERAGIRRGDVIVSVDGETVTKAEDLQRIVERSRVGQTLRFKIQRGDRTRTLSVITADLEKSASSS